MRDDKTFLADFYRRLYLIRRVEEALAEIYPTDAIQSPMHLSIGQELASVAVCSALRPTDKVFGTYRGHALFLAKGGDLKAFLCEMMGKAPGCTKGKGGSMHLADPDAGVMACSAIVGSTVPLAVGYALAEKMRGRDTVVASFFGDGATEEGAFYESINFAVLKKAPVLFVCENNFFAIHSPLKNRQARSITERVSGLLPVSTPANMLQLLDDEPPAENGDPFYVMQIAQHLVREIRESSGGGPRFLLLNAPRYREHVGPNTDWDAGYRTAASVGPYVARDPVAIFGREVAPDLRERLERDVEAELAAALDYAVNAPVPPDAELLSDVYGPPRVGFTQEVSRG